MFAKYEVIANYLEPRWLVLAYWVVIRRSN